MYTSLSLPRRWDPIVKLTHWGVVAAVLGNALITEEGSGWHIWVGYGAAALLALRLLWGLIGPAEARFSAFPPSPARALSHLGEIRRGEVTPHRSHNPLGALMAYAIWAMLAVICVTGIAMSGPPPADPAAVRGEHGAQAEVGERAGLGMAGAASAMTVAARDGDEDDGKAEVRGDGRGEDGEEGGEELGEVHEIAVNLLYILIALHLAGVVFESRRSGSQIVRAMVPGATRRR